MTKNKNTMIYFNKCNKEINKYIKNERKYKKLKVRN